MAINPGTLEKDRSDSLIDMVQTHVTLCRDVAKGPNPMGIASYFNIMATVGQATLDVLTDQQQKIRKLEARLQRLEQPAAGS